MFILGQCKLVKTGIILASSELWWDGEEGNADKWKYRAELIWIFVEMTLFLQKYSTQQ